MPVFYQQNIDDFTKIGIWKITEEEDFFLSRIRLNRVISHPHKRLQHLAGRHLLSVLFPDFPLSEIRMADTFKPFLENRSYYFSLSHSGDYAAAIVSSSQQVGLDIELATSKIEKVADKFLNTKEKQILDEGKHSSKDYLRLLTAIWASKEAIFKWYGRGGVDFKQHIQLLTNKIIINSDESVQLSFMFSKQANIILPIEIKMWDQLVLAYLHKNSDSSF